MKVKSPSILASSLELKILPCMMESGTNESFEDPAMSFPSPSYGNSSPWKRLKRKCEWDSGYGSFSLASPDITFHQLASPCPLDAGSFTDSCLNQEASFYNDSFPSKNTSTPEPERVSSALEEAEELRKFQHLQVDTYKASSASPRKSKARTRLKSLDGNRIDFLSQLSTLRPVIDKILNFLSDKDLSCITMVSRGWRNVCRKNEEAHRRWKTYVADRKARKENLVSHPIKKSSSNSPLAVMNHGTPLVLRQKLSSPPVSPSKIIFRRFQKEAEKLKPNEKLMKCPRCMRPAVCTPLHRGLCNGRDCQWEFCTKCLCDFHGSRPCAGSSSPAESPRKKQPAIMSKHSRRNLRRL